jgi:hypothetical protein
MAADLGKRLLPEVEAVGLDEVCHMPKRNMEMMEVNSHLLTDITNNTIST